MPATVLAIANQKGGVGKTTTAVNLGSAMSRQGIPTLLVDMDPQANATSSLGLEKKPGGGVYEPLIEGEDLTARVISTGRNNFWIIPSELDLAAAELELSSQPNYLTKLSSSIDRLRHEYGLSCILIDCPPTLGLLSMNSLCAADHLLVTLQSEYLALEGLDEDLAQGAVRGGAGDAHGGLLRYGDRDARRRLLRGGDRDRDRDRARRHRGRDGDGRLGRLDGRQAGRRRGRNGPAGCATHGGVESLR